MQGGQGQQTVWNALGFAWQLGYTIAIPIVVLALIGRFLDRRLGTTPGFMLAGIGVAIVISSIAISRKIRVICRMECKSSDANPTNVHANDTNIRGIRIDS